MKRVFCESCATFEFRQAVEVEPVSLRPSLAEVLSFALVFGAYYFVLAWAVAS